jgi:hypothetical protein
VTIPESGHNGFSMAINHARIFWDLDIAAPADSGNGPAGGYNDRVLKRSGSGRRIDSGVYESKSLCSHRVGGKYSQAQQEEKEKGGAGLLDHALVLVLCMPEFPIDPKDRCHFT